MNTHFSIFIKYKKKVFISKLRYQSSLCRVFHWLNLLLYSNKKIYSWLSFALLLQHATHTIDSQVRDSGGRCQLHQPCQAMVGWSQLGIGCGSPHSVMLGNGQWTWQAVLLLPMLPEYSQLQVCHFKKDQREIYSINGKWLPTLYDFHLFWKLKKTICIILLFNLQVIKINNLRNWKGIISYKSRLMKKSTHDPENRNTTERQGEGEIEG